MAKKKIQLPQSQNGGVSIGGGGGEVNTEILQSLCDKLETLIDVSSDATVLAEIVSNLEALIAGQGDVIAELMALCQKLLQNNLDNTTLIEALQAICDKIESGITGQDCDNPTHTTICGIDPEVCCVAAPGSLEVPVKCQSYRAESVLGDGNPAVTYSVGVGGEFVDLPNPNTDEDVIATLNGLCGDWSILVDPDTGRRTICNTNTSCPAAVWKQCRAGEGDFPTFQCGLATSAAIIVQPTLECTTRLPTVGCYDEKIADLLESILAVNNETLNKLCQMVEGPCPECTEPTPLVEQAVNQTTAIKQVTEAVAVKTQAVKTKLSN